MGNTYTRYPTTGTSGVPTYANFASLPGTAADGALGITLDTHNLYVYNVALGGWQLEASGGTTVTKMGALDGQPANATGGTIGSNSLYLQSATGTSPGLVNVAGSTTQVMGNGIKQFLSPVYLPDGSVSAPAIAFTNEPSTGFYRPGIGAFGFSLLNNDVIEAISVSSGSSTNFGFGIAASSAPSNPLNVAATYAGAATFAYMNLSTSGLASTVFFIGQGSGNIAITIENSAYQTGLYSSGGGMLSAGPSLSFLNICSEISTGYITMNVGGRNAASEKARFNLSNFTLTGGVSLILTGTSSGAATVTQLGPASGTNYSITWPTAQGAANTAPFNNGSGVLSWSPVNLSTNVIGSISLTNQVVNNLPLSQTSGSVSFSQLQPVPQFTIGSVTQTSSTGGAVYTIRWPGAQGAAGSTNFNDGAGNLYWALPSLAVGPGNVVGSLSLTSQVVGNLPLSQTSGSVTFSQLQTYNTFSIGSVTHTSSTGSGQSVFAFPGMNGTAGQFLATAGSGSVTGGTSWVTGLANPMTTSGDIVVGSSTGLPSRVALGTPTQVLTVSSGTTTGPVSWSTLTAPTQQRFTTIGGPSTYSTPVGCRFIKITVIGGGGGGGGAASGAAQGAAGGGGGGAGTCIATIANPAVSYQYTVGVGGVGGSGSGAGTAGSQSVFNATLVGNGGGAGAGSGGTTLNVVLGGAGGTASGGGLNVQGCPGDPAFVLSAAVQISGFGGATTLGGGGGSVAGIANGNGGGSYGGGGSGGSTNGASGSNTGGTGANGLIIVDEWYQ